MSKMLELMRAEWDVELEKIASEEGSTLVKAACGFLGEAMTGLIAPYFQQSPPANIEQIKELLGAYLERKLQNLVAEEEMSGGADPMAQAGKQAHRLADILDGRIRAARNMMELQEVQERLQAKMGPAMQAAAQMPLPLGPGATPPLPQPGGPQGGPPLPESPMEAAGGPQQ